MSGTIVETSPVPDGSETRTVRTVIVDDHPTVVSGVRDVLEADRCLEVVGDAGTVADARREVLRRRPDVAIVDVRLPDGDGIDLCARLRLDHPDVAVLVYTGEVTLAVQDRCREAGAVGLLPKTSPPARIRAAVAAAGDGEDREELWPEELQQPSERLLTEREDTVLALCAEGKTSAEIGEKLGIAESTVKTHIQNIMQKLGATNRAHMIDIAHRRNLLCEHAA